MTAEKAKHTPGPWRTDPAANFCVFGPDDHRVSYCYSAHSDRSDEEAAANASLISLSPIMLEMLKLLQAGYTPDPGTSDLYNEQPIYLRITLGDYRRMGHIISKAEGQK